MKLYLFLNEFEKDVQKLFVEIKGTFTIITSSIPGVSLELQALLGSVEEVAEACYRVARLITWNC